MKKADENRQYNNIKRLIDKLTRTEQSLNDTFNYYEFKVIIQSGTNGYFKAYVSLKEDNYCYIASFSFDYWTKEVHITDAVNDNVIMNIIEGFDILYGKKQYQILYRKRNLNGRNQ